MHRRIGCVFALLTMAAAGLVAGCDSAPSTPTPPLHRTASTAATPTAEAAATYLRALRAWTDDQQARMSTASDYASFINTTAEGTAARRRRLDESCAAAQAALDGWNHVPALPADRPTTAAYTAAARMAHAVTALRTASISDLTELSRFCTLYDPGVGAADQADAVLRRWQANYTFHGSISVGDRSYTCNPKGSSCTNPDPAKAAAAAALYRRYITLKEAAFRLLTPAANPFPGPTWHRLWALGIAQYNGFAAKSRAYATAIADASLSEVTAARDQYQTFQRGSKAKIVRFLSGQRGFPAWLIAQYRQTDAQASAITFFARNELTLAGARLATAANTLATLP